MLRSICALVLVILFVNTSANTHHVIKIQNGFVQGRIAHTEGRNEVYYAFQGIPYAEPPIGNLRFKPPVPKGNWNHTLNATKDGSICTQGKAPVTGSEDCLFINVYTPKLPSVFAHPLPTMVFIHGGGFEGGDSTYNLYGPDYLLEKSVVVVTFNYRLGVFGFLSTEDLEVPGNNGMKDQVLALKWVQANIRHFGGDPNMVTIFGQSAGSVSVSYHLQSPKSRGLFHRAIMESGVSLSPWGFCRHPYQVAKSVAKQLSSTIAINPFKNLVTHLRTINYEDLQIAASKAASAYLTSNNPLDGFAWGPVIEPQHEDAFFTSKSHQLLQSGNITKVPCIIGYNSLEGTFNFQTLFRIFLMQYDFVPSRLAPADLNIFTATERLIVGIKIKGHYFGYTPVFLSDEKLMQFLSDHLFVRPIREFVRQIAHRTSTYFYRFSYQGNLWGITQRTASGVTHSEELGYIFRSKFNATEKDSLVRQRMVTMWTNFAKSGNPTPRQDALLQKITWPRSDNEFTHLDIGENLVVEKYPAKESMHFWDELYRSHGRPPFDTY